MPVLHVVQSVFTGHSGDTKTNHLEMSMETTDCDTLAGRIDALGHALLSVVAELEMAQLIDGPRVSKAWRQIAPYSKASLKHRESAQLVLAQLAELLDEARRARAHRRALAP